MRVLRRTEVRRRSLDQKITESSQGKGSRTETTIFAEEAADRLHEQDPDFVFSLDDDTDAAKFPSAHREGRKTTSRYSSGRAS